MRLLEEYSVGQTLGEGAFGVVSTCRKRTTGEEYAVKMVDKVETPVEAIKREAELLQSLDHANIVKVHGVFFERCFVCIVMDKYGGGDLVEGLQRHLKERGQINCHDVVHVAYQMGASIQYLHRKSVIHRDVKGDNYLMDRKDMIDSKCKIVLTDFGTACPFLVDERLTAGVGTKIFWSPEFYDKNYGAKVDVWAMGIIMYGLVSGRFPFKDEHDVRNKEVKIPKRVHPLCEEFIRKMLDKVEKTRPTADAVMSHQWVESSARREGSVSKDQDTEETADGNLREENVNDGVKERRQELMQRLNREDELRRKVDTGVKRSATSHHMKKSFVLQDKQAHGLSMLYEWWDPAKVQSAKLLDPDGEVKAQSPDVSVDESYLKMFSSMLTEHNIDVKKFGQGQAKKLDQLAGEVRSGAARLMLDATSHKKLVRVVDIVLLRISFGDKERRLLIETEERYPDGRKRETLRLPGTKKEPYENTRQVAERILQDMLNMTGNAAKFDLMRVERHEEETESPSYPGVRTVYRKEMVEGVITMTGKADLEKVGLPKFDQWNFSDKGGNTKFFQWMTEKEAEAKKVKLKAEAAEAVSTLVRAPIGMAEEPLREHLIEHGIDVTAFGEKGCKTIKEFSAELSRGESTLQLDPVKKELVRIVDVILMIVKRPSGEILIQTEQADSKGNKTRLDRLPGAKCRPDENQFLSARRILRRQLEMDENIAVLSRQVGFVEEDRHSPAYPGLRTVYRKRMITATLQAAV
uniref:Protein kinase domain-containing protein n=1 Tax=Zooxanthella nutricula TaxID=1333877 RepID=A0A7S2P3Y2_9DINO